MVPERVEPKKFTVQHVRQPGQGMPITCATMGGGKGPYDRLAADATVDMLILSDVDIVIIVDEAIVTDRLKSNNSGQS